MQGRLFSFNTLEMKKWIAIAFLILLGVCCAHAGGKRALLIGISDYPAFRAPELTWNPIHGANDVELMKGTLRKKGFSITTITNSSATASKIRLASGLSHEIYIRLG